LLAGLVEQSPHKAVGGPGPRVDHAPQHGSLATFEQALPGSDRFTIIDDPRAGHTNVFSLDKSQG
jgi:hypothetical protein